MAPVGLIAVSLGPKDPAGAEYVVKLPLGERKKPKIALLVKYTPEIAPPGLMASHAVATAPGTSMVVNAPSGDRRKPWKVSQFASW